MPSLEDRKAELQRQLAATEAEIASTEDEGTKKMKAWLNRVEDRLAGQNFHATNIREVARVVLAVIAEGDPDASPKQAERPTPPTEQ